MKLLGVSSLVIAILCVIFLIYYTPSVNNQVTDEIAIGSTVIIPRWSWNTAVKPIKELLTNNETGPCGIKFGGTIEVEEVHGKNLLVKYTTENQTLGTECPSGTQFVIRKSDFITMTKQQKKPDG